MRVLQQEMAGEDVRIGLTLEDDIMALVKDKILTVDAGEPILHPAIMRHGYFIGLYHILSFRINTIGCRYGCSSRHTSLVLH